MFLCKKITEEKKKKMGIYEYENVYWIGKQMETT